MSAGRTISAKNLTDKDREILENCEKISKIIKENIPEENQSFFWNDFGKVSYSRDAGVGRGGGKLQRDALCTRGKSGKNPFSNRNLRWHPLVVASTLSPSFKTCSIRIDNDQKKIVVKINNNELLPEEVYQLPEPYCITSDNWLPFVDSLKSWEGSDWNKKNRMLIPAAEYAHWYDALESYTVLGVIVAVSMFNADKESTYNETKEFVSNISIDEIELPTEKFPSLKESKYLFNCPICLSPLNQPPASLPKRNRPIVWSPPWMIKKRTEGDDASLQILHIKPLIESEIRHNAENVRFGHRWCNVAQTDHSIEELIEFMKRVYNKHKELESSSKTFNQ